MSSMRNAVQRRNHKERAQPLEREKWGVLEKHKDYSLRARDYNEKKARLKILRQKAAERNQDEFHYGMLSSKSTKGRKLGDRGNTSLSQNAVKLLKTQDIGYLQTMIQKIRRAIQKLEHEFVLGKGEDVDVLGGEKQARKGQHLVFVNDEDEQRQYDPKSNVEDQSNQRKALTEDEEDEDVETDGEACKPKSRRKADQKVLAAKEQKILRKKHKKRQEAQKSKLNVLKAQEKDLRDAENELQLQRAKMNNNVGGVTKSGVKWKVGERKS